MKKNGKEITELHGHLSKNHIVQKPEPLLLMRKVPFELGELKILDTYLARINSHDPTCRTVTFTKAEYEELMGLSNVDMRTLKKYTKSMLQKVVELKMPDGYMQFTLFTRSRCRINEYGQQIIELSCSEDAKEIFFNVEGLRYLRYELRNTLSLTSKYSFLLYLYLRKERYRGTWEVSLTELRDQKLDCKDIDTYQTFKYFKRDILDKSIREINKKTDVSIRYETIKKARSITAIRFIVNTLPVIPIENDIEPSQIIIEQRQNECEELWAEPLKEFNLKKEQLDELRELLAVIPDFMLPELPGSMNSIDLRRYHYMALKAAEIKRRDSERPIRSKFGYLKKMIQKDIKEE